MQVNGQCHCGAIAYEATVDPGKATVCHCHDCQSFSGAPFRASVPARAEDFHIRKGQPRDYVKTAESGTRRAQGFCGDCGSALYSTTDGDRRVYSLRLGAIQQRAQIPALRQIWCESALDWARNISPLPGVPKG